LMHDRGLEASHLQAPVTFWGRVGRNGQADELGRFLLKR